MVGAASPVFDPNARVFCFLDPPCSLGDVGWLCRPRVETDFPFPSNPFAIAAILAEWAGLKLLPCYVSFMARFRVLSGPPRGQLPLAGCVGSIAG